MKPKGQDTEGDPATLGMCPIFTRHGCPIFNRQLQSQGTALPSTDHQRKPTCHRTNSDWGPTPTKNRDTLGLGRWHSPAFQSSEQRRPLTLGVDVAASTAGDESVVAIARGGFVQRLETFREPDTMKTVGIIVSLFKRLSVRRMANLGAENALLYAGLERLVLAQPGDPATTSGSSPAVIRVDEIGVGKGVGDRIRESGYSCEPFIASRKPESTEGGERYANVRAEAADRLRSLLVRGAVALPPDDLLREELLTCQQVITSTGKPQIWSKKEWRGVIGRSPDRLDSVIMAVAGTGVIDFATTASESGAVATF